jgi:hypothetical protein
MSAGLRADDLAGGFPFTFTLSPFPFPRCPRLPAVRGKQSYDKTVGAAQLKQAQRDQATRWER